jgi:3-phosphoshikimate 1-carboxyvinyltransferase
VREAEVFLGNAGTATRFLTAALCLRDGRYTVDGDARMRERPIGDLVRALRDLGADIEAPTGCPPVHIGRSSAAGGGSGLAGGSVTVPGRISSQFISAILLAAPLARRDVEVLVDGVCVSRPYIDITLEVMRAFGAEVWADDGRADGRTAFRVKAGRGYGGRELRIEGDASTASYFLAAAAVTGGTVRIEGIGKESIQGDARFADLLAQMGCHVKKDLDSIGLTGDRLHGIEADCRDMPDVVPTLAAVALFARGRTRIHNVAHLKFKESDRIASVAAEFRKLGGKVRELPDGLEIEESRLHPGTVDPWGDHRIAMASAVVGLGVPGVVIRDPQVVAKSYPEFFEVFRSAGARVAPLEAADLPAGVPPGGEPGSRKPGGAPVGPRERKE